MKALVTGAAGFVGRYLVAHLEAMGDKVDSLDHHGPDPVDVTDSDAVRDRVAESAPDAVYHLAGVSHVGSSWSAPLEVFRINTEGAINVLRACVDSGVARVLVTGSADAYGATAAETDVLREDLPLRPLSPYGVSKAAAELCALQAYLADGLAVTCVRAFNHTGPGQLDRFLVPSLARRIVEAERTGAKDVKVGNLDAIRDFSDVRDVVRAYRLLVEHGVPGEVYNVCSGSGVRVADIAGRMLAAAETELSLSVDPALVRPIEVPRLIGSNERLRAATGWEPAHTLEATLADVLSYWRDQP